jgi:hypothetical protein
MLGRASSTLRTLAAPSLEQLLQSLETLACRHFVGFGGCYRPLRFDALIALRRHEWRDDDQSISATNAGAGSQDPRPSASRQQAR